MEIFSLKWTRQSHEMIYYLVTKYVKNLSREITNIEESRKLSFYANYSREYFCENYSRKKIVAFC